MQLKSQPKTRRSGGAMLRAFLGASLLLVQLSRAQVADTYENTGYYLTGSGAPVINATNFINDYGATFSVNFTNFTTQGFLSGLYSGWYYTRNFSNGVDQVGGGEMDCNTGFYFDTQLPFINAQTPSGHFEANNFFNNGNINCGLTGNFFFFTISVNGVITSSTFNSAGIYIYATNIVNPGTLHIEQNGLGKIIGHNLDFNRGTILMDNQNTLTNTFTGFSGQVGAFGLNTNGAWNPGFNLQPNFASASQPYPLSIINSTAYLDFTTNNSTSNIVVRAMFVLNSNSNSVVENHYFFPGNTNINGSGTALIEWLSSYLNPSDGSYVTNYLYLVNDYLLGASTNVVLINNTPNNFSFTASTTPLSAGLTLATNTGFPVGFSYPLAGISNRYSYASVKLISTSVDTNSAFRGILTNLAGRVEITAATKLNLSLSSISGMNYLRLNSTNQYDNDGSSQIIAPYSDTYLGSTNGNLSITNLYSSVIPGWGGNVQAWSTQWTNTDASGYVYDYRVLIVQSAITPYSLPLQQDFFLYSSNNVIISDTLNVFRTLSINATNLTLSTNEAGAGSDSLRGELNLNSLNMLWATSLPRLRNLTNNGAIRTLNIANYGSAALPYYNIVNTGIITNGNGAISVAGNFENSGYISGGNGSFSVQSLTTTMTSGGVSAGGTFSVVADRLVVSNSAIGVGKAMTLIATNLITDGGTTNNFWSLGTSNLGSGIASGLVMPIKPTVANLLGTSITNIAVNGTLVNDVWPGDDRGYSVSGFSNNAAIGQLILDVQGNTLHSQIKFAGIGSSNAIYVDRLILLNYASYTNRSGANLPAFLFNTNLVIYYAQALIGDGTSVAEKINHFNTNHFRWVPSYTGYFSSTNLVYPPGVTNTVNAALASSAEIDSDGDGIPNASDSTPFLTPTLLNFTIGLTNNPAPKSAQLQWQTIPNSTNYIFYKTNLLQDWSPFTNFNYFYYGANVKVTNASHVNWFASPLSYPSNPPVSDFRTNVWVFDAVTNTPHFYRVLVQPWLTYPN